VSGFSLIEVLIVVVIIGVMAAVIAPAVMRYLRTYRLQAAAQSVAGEIQTARIKAISKNVNLGVIFGVNTDRTYGWSIEDDIDPVNAPNWTSIGTEPWATLADPASGQTPGLRTLPFGLVFTNPATCRGGGVATDWAIRFRRLGTACNIGGAGCPAPPGAPIPPLFMRTAGGEHRLCLFSADTGMRWTIRVTSSGRVITERGDV
jgi:prepilin-type N-terminal cleavage/methylation domain-containing protein